MEEELGSSARRLVLMRDQGWSGGLTITSSGIWSGQVGGLGLLKGKGTGQVAVVVGCGGGLDDRKPGPQGERSGPIRCPGHTQRMVVIRELWDGWMDGWMGGWVNEDEDAGVVAAAVHSRVGRSADGPISR